MIDFTKENFTFNKFGGTAKKEHSNLMERPISSSLNTKT